MLWTTRTFLMLAVGFIGYVGYQGIQGEDQADHPLRVDMAEQVARQAALALPIPDGRPLLAVAPVTADFDGLVGLQLRNWIARRNAILADLTWWESVVPRRFRLGDQVTPELSCHWAAQKKIPYVIHARVLDWTTDPYPQRKLTIQVQLIATNQNAILYSNQFCLDSSADIGSTALPLPKIDQDPSMPAVSHRNEVGEPYRPQDPLVQFLVWLISGLILPWLGASVIGRAVRADSNVGGFMLVAGYLGFMGALAWYLWGNVRGSWLSWSCLLLLSSSWVGYLEFVCRMLDNQPERI